MKYDPGVSLPFSAFPVVILRQGHARLPYRRAQKYCSSLGLKCQSEQASSWPQQLRHDTKRQREQDLVVPTRLAEVGITQRHWRDAKAVSYQPVMGLLGMCNISTTVLDSHCTSARREQASEGCIGNLPGLLNLLFRVRASTGDQSPQASIAPVRASKSETLSWTLCLRTSCMKEVLICVT